jgi:hypothetical protein
VLAAAFGAAYGIGDATAGGGHGESVDGSNPRAIVGKGGCEFVVLGNYAGAVAALRRISPSGHDGETRYVEDRPGGDLRVSCTVTIDGRLVVSDEGRHDSADLSASAWRRRVRAAAPPGEADQGVAVRMGSMAVSFPSEAAVRITCRRPGKSKALTDYTVSAIRHGRDAAKDPTLRQDLVILDAAMAHYVSDVECSGRQRPIPSRAPRLPATVRGA